MIQDAIVVPTSVLICRRCREPLAQGYGNAPGCKVGTEWSVRPHEDLKTCKNRARNRIRLGCQDKELRFLLDLHAMARPRSCSCDNYSKCRCDASSNGVRDDFHRLVRKYDSRSYTELIVAAMVLAGEDLDLAAG